MANFQITRKAFADAIDRTRITFDLSGATPGNPIADRLHVEAECPTEAGSYAPQVANHGLVKDAVTAGALTAAQATALKTTLGKLVNWLLSDYD